MAQQKLNTQIMKSSIVINTCTADTYVFHALDGMVAVHLHCRVNNIILAHYEYKVVILIIIMGDCSTNELKGRTKQQLGQDAHFLLGKSMKTGVSVEIKILVLTNVFT